ncbi:MAG: Holliday junction resolvase RuvX [Vampirovibrionales bacterium]
MSHPYFKHNTESGRLLAIDYGDKRLGLAVSDPMGWFAVGLPTLIRKQPQELWVPLIAQAVSSYSLKGIIVGMPYHMDGSPSAKSIQITHWINTELAPEIAHIPVGTVDERLTSSEAEDRLKEQGQQPSRNKPLVDELAACLMIEQALRHPQSICWGKPNP